MLSLLKCVCINGFIHFDAIFCNIRIQYTGCRIIRQECILLASSPHTSIFCTDDFPVKNGQFKNTACSTFYLGTFCLKKTGNCGYFPLQNY